MQIKAITAEEVNRDIEKWFFTLSKFYAIEYAKKKQVFKLPNGVYVMERMKA